MSELQWSATCLLITHCSQGLSHLTITRAAECRPRIPDRSRAARSTTGAAVESCSRRALERHPRLSFLHSTVHVIDQTSLTDEIIEKIVSGLMLMQSWTLWIEYCTVWTPPHRRDCVRPFPVRDAGVRPLSWQVPVTHSLLGMSVCTVLFILLRYTKY